MSAHTPGAWVWGGYYLAGKPAVSTDDASDETIATCHGKNKEANARLIAAAPELLEALQAIVAIDGHSAITEAEADAIHARAIAAIAKAVQS